MSVRPSWFDVTTRWQMIGTVLRWNPAMIPPELVGCKSVTRSHRVTFFVSEHEWRELRSKDLRVDRILTYIGRSSFKQYAVVTRHGSPVLSLTTTIIAVDDSLTRSIPLPLADTMRAAMKSQFPRANRVQGMVWPEWAAPGGGSEHGEPADPLFHRPDNAFCFHAVVRWVECDEFGHMSQSQYALLIEEARATAAASGAYGTDAVNKFAKAAPVRFNIDYVGQAKPGDDIRIFTWWDGQSVCCEMEKDGRKADTAELLIQSRVWLTAESHVLATESSVFDSDLKSSKL